MVCMPPHVFAFCVVLSALASGIVVASQRIHRFAREKFRRLLEPYGVHKPHLGHRRASRQLDRDSEGPLIVEVRACVGAFVTNTVVVCMKGGEGGGGSILAGSLFSVPVVSVVASPRAVGVD